MNGSIVRQAGAFAIAVAALAGCGSVPQRHATMVHAVRASDGSKPVTVPVPAQDSDLLATMLAGEFALSDADVGTSAQQYLAAAKLSDDPAIAAQAVRLGLAAKNWALAREALARWQKLAPNDLGVRQAEATLALAEGKRDPAYAVLADLAQQPEAKGWRLVGQVLLGATDKAAAGDVLDRLVTPEALAGAGDEIWIAMSQLAFKLDRKPLAQRLADLAAQKFGSGDDLAWQAQLAAETGDKRKAKKLFADALAKSPKNTRLRAAYAALLADMGENSTAAKVLAQGPQDDYSYAARAAYAARANDKPAMRTLYDELKARPEAERAPHLQLLGQLAELLEQPDAAQKWYAQVSEDDPHWFEAQLRVAVLYDAAGKTEAAMNLAHELQIRAGDEPRRVGDAFLLEAELLSRRQLTDAAIEAYTRGLKVLPDDTRLLYGRGLILANADHVADAERDLRRVLELKPDDSDALNALGYTLADGNQKLEEALTLIERAMKLKPDEPAVMDSYGWVQYRLGRLPEAESSLRRAYAKQPDAEIAAHLGEVLWHAGNKAEARKVFEAGKKKDAKNKVLLETLQRVGA